jgi:hypothetical protein
LRKISLIPYKIEDGQEYEVVPSLVSALFIPALNLNARRLIENDRIARKIEQATDSVLLEESEYLCVKEAFDTFTGYKRQDAELVERVTNAPIIEVKEA